MDEDATWYGSRPRRRPHCIRRVPSAPRKAHSTPTFRPMSIVVTVAHLSYCWALVLSAIEKAAQILGMTFNTKKTVCMVFNPINKHKQVCSIFPCFSLAGCPLSFVSQLKYLGHIIDNTSCDDADIAREVKSLFARTNILLRRFHRCSVEVKLRLFRCFCMCFYDIALWFSFSRTAYNKLLTKPKDQNGAQWQNRFCRVHPKTTETVCCTARWTATKKRIGSVQIYVHIQFNITITNITSCVAAWVQAGVTPVADADGLIQIQGRSYDVDSTKYSCSFSCGFSLLCSHIFFLHCSFNGKRMWCCWIAGHQGNWCCA